MNEPSLDHDALNIENALVLVTGASGFISSHVIDQLLARGARVRATVRSDDKGAVLRELFQHAGDRFQYVLVGDIEKVGIQSIFHLFFILMLVVGGRIR